METNNSPFFSIIIPVYHVEKYVGKCLTSIIEQQFTSYEVICVDDGSKDNSGIICDEYAGKYSFIKTYHKANEGLGFTRNFGMEKARGEYLFFIDSDDFLPNDSCLTSIHECIIQTHADVVVINHCTCNAETEVINTENAVFGNERDNVFYFNNNYFTPSACFKLVRRQFIVNQNIRFMQGISEDFLWTAKILSCNPSIAYLLDDYYYCYRNFRKGSLTETKDISNINHYVQILRDMTELYNGTEMMSLFLSKSYFDLFMTIINKFGQEELFQMESLEYFYTNRKFLKLGKLRKPYILYIMFSIFGIKMTIRFLKMLKQRKEK